MDAYSDYNQIKIDLMGAATTTFMSNHDYYYYNDMPFRLKNTCVTYQRLMDTMFLKQIERNLEVYIDDMTVKTSEGKSHTPDLEYIMELIRIYNMLLNSAKCSFEVQRGKFIGFMLTKIGIKANPNKSLLLST